VRTPGCVGGVDAQKSRGGGVGEKGPADD
jgi:hypothetical protein